MSVGDRVQWVTTRCAKRTSSWTATGIIEDIRPGSGSWAHIQYAVCRVEKGHPKHEPKGSRTTCELSDLKPAA